MNDNQINTTPTKERLRLPKPDPKNITVLTPNLPNQPILPWNRFDSPWFHRKAKKPEQLLLPRSVTFQMLILTVVIASIISSLSDQYNHQSEPD